jgi:hypothetical protein
LAIAWQKGNGGFECNSMDEWRIHIFLLISQCTLNYYFSFLNWHHRFFYFLICFFVSIIDYASILSSLHLIQVHIFFQTLTRFVTQNILFLRICTSITYLKMFPFISTGMITLAMDIHQARYCFICVSFERMFYYTTFSRRSSQNWIPLKWV